jgi:hypothetical protein
MAKRFSGIKVTLRPDRFLPEKLKTATNKNLSGL